MLRISASIVLATLLALPRPAAAQYCYYNGFNNYVCDNGWSYGARAGVGIAIAAAFIILLSCFFMIRRRRMRSMNAVFLTNPNGAVNQPTPLQPTQAPFGPAYYGQGNNNFANAEAGYKSSYPPPPAYNPTDTGAQYPPKVYSGAGYTVPEQNQGESSYPPPPGSPGAPVNPYLGSEDPTGNAHNPYLQSEDPTNSYRR